MTSVCAMCMLPPPVQVLSLANQAVIEAIGDEADVDLFDWSPKMPTDEWPNRRIRLAKGRRCLASALWRLFRKPANVNEPFLEAMLCGKPAIAFDRGCIAALLDDGAGRVIPAGEAFAARAAQQVVIWLEEPELYAEMSQRCRNRGLQLKCDSVVRLQRFLDMLISGEAVDDA